MAETTDQKQLANFKGLPLKDLILDPLVACAQGQKQLSAATMEWCEEFAWETKDGKSVARTIDVEIERLMDGTSGQTAKQLVKMPIISMVTIPNLSIQDTEIKFTMEVKNHTENTEKTGSETTNTAGGSISGGFLTRASCNFSHTGKVTSSSENTRSTDFSAKYDLSVSAKQNPPAEGMAKFTQMMASSMEPVDLAKS
tara:strand:+ start:6216 stop:6809 length:594 start_codon:yes stop_codon:yes gene_type:complete